jgi:hypothetical protein
MGGQLRQFRWWLQDQQPTQDRQSEADNRAELSLARIHDQQNSDCQAEGILLEAAPPPLPAMRAKPYNC